MKKLSLSNPSYRYLENSFKEWLDVQGYAHSTVYNLPNHIRELLHYLETQCVSHITQFQTKHIQDYYEHLKERHNQRHGGALSNAHLNKHIQALRRFTEYLRKVGRLQVPHVPLDQEETETRITYLTESEIQTLFKATYQRPQIKPNHCEEIQAAIQSRDRAMLAIFYGCGLRRSEGVSLDVSDINFDKSVLHVRKGKNYQERLVPISPANRKYLTEYVYDYRPTLAKGSKIDALFISHLYRRRMQGQSLGLRLKRLQTQSDRLALQEKEVSLHTLRHSIATHLLAAGMPLDDISQFLGHSSLESTQIYTHLIDIEREQLHNNIPSYEITQLHEDEY